MYALMLWTIISINMQTGETEHGWLKVEQYETIFFEGVRLKAKDICMSDAKSRKIPDGQWKCFSET